MHVFKLAALIACLFAVSSSVAAPFPVSGRTTVTTMRVAAGSGVVPYQAYSSKAKCQVPIACTITYPAITDSGVFIQHVSCAFEVKTGGVPAYASLDIEGQSGFNILSTNKLSPANGGDLYDANGQTDLFVDVGQQPSIVIAVTDKKIAGMSCTISGFHV